MTITHTICDNCKHENPGPTSKEVDYDSDSSVEDWRYREFDLVSLEANILRYRPLFTRKGLQRYSQVRDRILTDPEFRSYDEKDVYGKVRCLWQRWRAEDDHVSINYLTAVEMHPSLHVNGNRTHKIEQLHELNPVDNSSKETENEYILCPVFFDSFRTKDVPGWTRNGQNDHLNASFMASLRMQMANVRRIWKPSMAASWLEGILQRTAPHTAQIKKIVGFGLGRLPPRTTSPKKRQSMLQHLTAFSIANTLTAVYRKADPSTPLIKVVLQDPMYTERDRIIIREQYPEGEVKFVSDPDGFLEVDESTLVIAPFIVIDVPVLQICADLCRPAGFLCDCLSGVNPKLAEYSWQNRSSPRVARMLQGYRTVGFRHLNVEEEMKHYVCAGLPIWLHSMNLWLKPERKPQRTPEPKPKPEPKVQELKIGKGLYGILTEECL